MKKRNHKILLQIGFIVTFIFLIFLIICVCYIIWTTEKNVVASKVKPIYNDFNEISESLSGATRSKQISNYWLDNSSKLSKDIKPGIFDARAEIEYTDNEIIEKGFNTFTDKEQYVVAESCYYYDTMALKTLVHSSFYYEIFCVSVDSVGTAKILIYDSASDSSKYSLGDIYSENFYKLGPVKKILSDDYTDFTYELTGDIFMPDTYAYYPVKNPSGNIATYCILHYKMDDIISYSLQDSFELALLIIVICLIILDLVCFIFIRHKATKPLTSIQSALRGYMDNKDSDAVVEKMSKIKLKNEFGILSEDISALAIELDKYAIDNIKLTQDKERVKSELSLASVIQDDSLIKEFPDTENITLFASMTPAKEVGGDFYDFFYVDDTHLALVIADVSGKGIPASLVMMAAMTSIRNYTMYLSDPAEIFEKVNIDLCSRNNMDMFVTAWLGILDLKTGSLVTANAGHEFPAINTTGRYEIKKEKHCFVLGGMSGIKYRNETIQLKPGDSIFVYTDGVAEATNITNELFGTDRLLEALNTDPQALPEETLKNVKESVDHFIRTAQQFDDLTMLCLKFKGTL